MNAPTNNNELPGDLVAAMLADVAATDVSGDTAARIKARVLQRIGTPEPPRPGFIDVLAGSGWKTIAPGVEIKVLFEDDSARAWMLRLHAGCDLPAHDHDEGDEECLVLEGRVWLDDKEFGPGDYQLAHRGTRHGRVHSEVGCLLFLRSTFAGAPVA